MGINTFIFHIRWKDHSEFHSSKNTRIPWSLPSGWFFSSQHQTKNGMNFLWSKKNQGTFLAKTYQECCWANLPPAGSKRKRSGNWELFRWVTWIPARNQGVNGTYPCVIFRSCCFCCWFLGPFFFVTPKWSGQVTSFFGGHCLMCCSPSTVFDGILKLSKPETC